MKNKKGKTKNKQKGITLISLVVTIGEGQGEKWWCVLFPPFCLLDEENKTEVEYHFYIKDMLEKYF